MTMQSPKLEYWTYCCCVAGSWLSFSVVMVEDPLGMETSLLSWRSQTASKESLTSFSVSTMSLFSAATRALDMR